MSKIIVPTSDGMHLINIEDILYLKSEDIYAYVYTNSEKLFTTVSLGRIEKGLKRHSFFRCHKSYLVNLDHLAKITKGVNYQLILSSGAKIPLSRTKKKLLIEHLKTQKKFISYHRPQ